MARSNAETTINNAETPVPGPQKLAMDALVALLDDPDPQIRFDAAKAILDAHMF